MLLKICLLVALVVADLVVADGICIGLNVFFANSTYKYAEFLWTLALS